jgi:hypothetical protein
MGAGYSAGIEAERRVKIRCLAPALLVLLVAGAVSWHAWFQPIRWTPDGLYYQAKALSYRGQDENQALHAAFRSPLADTIRSRERRRLREEPGGQHQFTNPGWIDYTSRFFHRRILVPLGAAAVYPIFGLRSVLAISLIGYLLLSLALLALLRRRFGPVVSVLVTSACLLAPPLRNSSFVPGTDSWGVLLEVCALLAAVLTFDRGLRWLGAWVLALALLSITRDDSVVPLVAVGCLSLQVRERRSLLLLGSGIAAILPAVIVWGNSSVRENLAFVFSGYNPPKDESWSFVLSRYPSHLGHLLSSDFSWGTTLGWQGPLWYLALAAILVGAVLLIKRLGDGDPYFRLHAYAFIGSALFVGFFDEFTHFRQELVFIPSAAVAMALVVDLASRGLVAALGNAGNVADDQRQRRGIGERGEGPGGAGGALGAQLDS